MLRPEPRIDRVYLHRAPIDMRKQRNGLAALVQEVLKENPFSGGAIFVYLKATRPHQGVVLGSQRVHRLVQSDRRRKEIFVAAPPRCGVDHVDSGAAGVVARWLRRMEDETASITAIFAR